jgi:hypothetical protein
MKAFLILIVSFSFTLTAFGQALTYTKVDGGDLVYILNNISVFSQYHSYDSSFLYITVYCVSDPSGSAGFENCEITKSIYIAVSEYGEAPDQNLFKLSSVYDPKFIKWILDKNEPKFSFTYGVESKRRKATIGVKLNSLDISVK